MYGGHLPSAYFLMARFSHLYFDFASFPFYCLQTIDQLICFFSSLSSGMIVVVMRHQLDVAVGECLAKLNYFSINWSIWLSPQTVGLALAAPFNKAYLDFMQGLDITPLYSCVVARCPSSSYLNHSVHHAACRRALRQAN